MIFVEYKTPDTYIFFELTFIVIIKLICYCMDFNIIANKVRFHYVRLNLLLKKYRTVYEICPKGIPSILAIVSIVVSFILNIFSYNGWLSSLVEIIRNVSYSYIAGYIFYLVSDILPKANKKLNEIKYVIENELCILSNAKYLLDTSILFSRVPNDETDNIRRFIINCTESNPYQHKDGGIKFNDIFLNRLRFIQNDCRNSFNILLLHKADLLTDKEKSQLYQIKDFIFLSLFHSLEHHYTFFLSELETECGSYCRCVNELESSIQKQLNLYVYNPCEYERFNKLLKETGESSMCCFEW